MNRKGDYVSMLTNYLEYLESPKSLTVEQMQSIHSQMILEIGNDNEGLEFYDELIEKAVQYASYRANWFVWDRETRMEQDESRSSCHNSCTMDIQMVKGAKNIFLGGEGLFNTVITGPGKVYLQSMPISNITDRLLPYLPSSSSSDGINISFGDK